MNNEQIVELYFLKCAALGLATQQAMNVSGQTSTAHKIEQERFIAPFIAQFPFEMRKNAEHMSEYYKLFFMIENDMRRLIDETLTESSEKADWWEALSPPSAKEEYKQNAQREQEAGVTSRSDNPLDYISFGQLGEIMRFNWNVFGGILSNQKAMGRVMFSLNMLRGPIAHCGLLAEDEAERLKLSVKDWFRLLEGPKNS